MATCGVKRDKKPTIQTNRGSHNAPNVGFELGTAYWTTDSWEKPLAAKIAFGTALSMIVYMKFQDK